MRRIYLDLIGLPPTVEQIDQFVQDKDPNRYQRLVEHLLDSPHHGEKWARHWLDAARYADSDGFEKDKPRQVWMYRDWVVNALNQDLPYDQFIVQQIAGDLLPDATQDQKVATGFLRQLNAQRRRRDRPRTVPCGGDVRSYGCVGKSRFGYHRAVCPVP